jgi:FtsH-binding integral membrane protein
MAWDRDLSYDRDYDREYAGRNALSAERVAFIRSTFAHLAGAVLAFIVLAAILVNTIGPQITAFLFGGGSLGWLLVLGAFMGISMLAQWWVRNEASPGTQYLGLGLYVAAEAFIMTPLLWICVAFSDPTLIPTAGLLTLGLTAGLVATAFLTKKDFSGLYPILMVGGFIAMGVIVAACIFGFHLGLFFAFAMVALLSGFILYEASSLIHTFPTHMPVAAALMLFASIATLFWWILRILMELNNRN